MSEQEWPRIVDKDLRIKTYPEYPDNLGVFREGGEEVGNLSRSNERRMTFYRPVSLAQAVELWRWQAQPKVYTPAGKWPAVMVEGAEWDWDGSTCTLRRGNVILATCWTIHAHKRRFNCSHDCPLIQIVTILDWANGQDEAPDLPDVVMESAEWRPGYGGHNHYTLLLTDEAVRDISTCDTETRSFTVDTHFVSAAQYAALKAWAEKGERK